MSIKSDRWIRRMAAAGMIDPFSPDQVRTANGHKIISYGTSSYGYDVRCAEDFKIFTTIVDPKNFDEKSFVDFNGPMCIIPPNSFALASTVEYFRIPRSVLTVCLGKCVAGDTRVVDADTGAYESITEMRWGKRTLAWDGWRLRPAKVSAFIPQGKRDIFELRTRSGLRIRTTANHPFRMLNRWMPLGDLRPGDRIAVAREIPVFGKTPIPDWEATLLGLMISEGQCHTPGHSPTYTTADAALVALLKSTMAASGMGEEGIPARNRVHDWLRSLKLDVGAGDRFVPQGIFTAPEPSVRLFLQALFSGDGSICDSDRGVFLEYYSKSRRLIEDVHHLLLRFGIFSLIREKTTAIGTHACKVQITDKDQILRFTERVGFSPGSVKQRVLEEKVLPMIAAQPKCKSNFDTLPQEAWATAGTAARVGGMTLGSIGIHASSNQSMPISASRRVGRMTGDPNISPLIDGPIWDEVEAIEPAGIEEVFDITVPTLHNFVANDFIVHNSTYARCFRGDTRVALVDGTAPTLEQMANRHAAGELFWGYSIGEHGRLIVTLLDKPRFVGRDSLLEIELDNGERIHATPDHLFMKRDGRMAPAHSLRPNDALMPLYRDLVRGYEEVYQPIDGFLYATHRLADEWNLRHRLYEDVAGTRAGIAEQTVRRALNDSGSIRGAAELLNCDRSVFRRFPEVIAEVRGTPAYRNHRVVSVREIPGDHDVYCLTVPEAGNFALESGVFVKNCGIIVNVTPLEPEWEGHVTLEFSNTTPLPAKIYANEGVAQMLFFESDEVCETSYRDRGGKYQGQRGVTLPKA
jgi:deoxycytidine triphosphate deaminase/intein/homing endonuclease